MQIIHKTLHLFQPSLLPLILLLLLFLLPTPSANPLQPVSKQRNLCTAACRFRFCRRGDIFSLIIPGKPTGAPICRQGQNIESILSIGEPQALIGRTRIPISKWRPKGLFPTFDRDFFQTKNLRQKRVMSTIIHKQMRGNQSDILNQHCFVLPIKRYQRDLGGKIVNVKAGQDRDCIEFQAITSDVYIALVWFSGDDLDLVVTEPDKSQLSQSTVESRTTVCGRHRRDNGVGACEFFDFNREVVEYSFGCPQFQEGVYRAAIRHAANCANRDSATKWELYVVVKGRIQRLFKGKANKDRGALIKTVSFRLRRPSR